MHNATAERKGRRIAAALSLFTGFSGRSDAQATDPLNPRQVFGK
jgi:hypothetical protein